MIAIKMKRYHGVAIATGLIFLLACLIFYGWLVEPKSFTVKRVAVKSNAMIRAWGPLRIVHISDLHILTFSEREEKIIQKINSLAPDLICITGDLGQWDAKHTDVIRFLTSLHGKYGVYVVLGDSDLSAGRQRCFYCHPSTNIHKLRERPRFLRDECSQILLDSQKNLVLCGVGPSTGSSKGKWDKFWQSELSKWYKKKLPVLLLSHFSKFWNTLPDDFKLLCLSGNTHGGQIWVPAIFRPVFFREKDYRHLNGLFSSGRGKWLYVNPGLGTTSSLPIRIGVKPEITLIDIKRQ